MCVQLYQKINKLSHIESINQFSRETHALEIRKSSFANRKSCESLWRSMKTITLKVFIKQLLK